MRLYLSAESKNKVGYTPDWLKVSFYENGERMELTLDIQGDIDYDKYCLSCRCKGAKRLEELEENQKKLDETGDEIDLYSLTDERVEKMFPDERVAKIICESEDYEIGIYPVTNGDCDDKEIFKSAEEDSVSNCKGSFEMFIDDEKYYQKDFEFETELNIG